MRYLGTTFTDAEVDVLIELAQMALGDWDMYCAVAEDYPNELVSSVNGKVDRCIGKMRERYKEE